MILGAFPILGEWGGTSCKNFSISIFGFLMCSQINVEGWFKFCTPYMVYSHIWVYLAWDYCHFFYILPLWLKTKTLKKNIDAHGYKIKSTFFFFFLSAPWTYFPHVLWLERKRLILTGWIKAHFPLNICTFEIALSPQKLLTFDSCTPLKVLKFSKEIKQGRMFQHSNYEWSLLHGIKFSLPILRAYFKYPSTWSRIHFF
jgi:hypothetical protein